MADSTQVLRRRGTSSQIAAMTPALGEIVVNTTTKTAHVGDGTTAGGFPLAKVDSPAFTGNPTAPTPSPGDSDTSIATTAFVAAAVAAIPPATGMPAAVTGSLTTGSTAAFTVDFATYSAYDVYLEGVSVSTGSTLTVNVSSNGGTSFAAEARSNTGYNGSSVVQNTGYDLQVPLLTPSGLVGTLVQGGPSGGAFLGYSGGTLVGSQAGTVRYATSAAVNQVRLSLGGGSTFTAGTVVLQPKARR